MPPSTADHSAAAQLFNCAHACAKPLVAATDDAVLPSDIFDFSGFDARRIASHRGEVPRGARPNPERSSRYARCRTAPRQGAERGRLDWPLFAEQLERPGFDDRAIG